MQPIPEVSELSQRRAVDGSQLAVPEDGLHPARRDGTLRRTGSLRFANKVGHESRPGQGHVHGRRQGDQQGMSRSQVTSTGDGRLADMVGQRSHPCECHNVTSMGGLRLHTRGGEGYLD